MRYILIMRLPLLASALALGSLAFVTGCSEPVPPTPQGAWSVDFTQTDPTMCLIAGHNSGVGAVSADARDKVEIDGLDGASITCEVNGAGPFSASGQASQNGRNLSILIASISPTTRKDAPVKGGVSYASEKTAGEPYSSSGDCDFWFDEGTNQSVAAGKIWVAFACPLVVNSTDKCGISQGYAIFENCTTDQEVE